VTGQDEVLRSASDARLPDDDDLDQNHLRAVLKDTLGQLTERERTVVESRFGLFGAKYSMTLEQLGKVYGLSKERIRQIETQAIDKIKTVLSPRLADLIPE
jgi:RNA polymerase sigma factor (sigma-70 family)